MRLWHQALISKLPRQQLLGQHRECCALRGNGWGKKHSTVNYVFEHSYARLVAYHNIVMTEMAKRGYTPAREWWNHSYRGRWCSPSDITSEDVKAHLDWAYPEHDDNYRDECISNLEAKGIAI